MSKKGGGKSPKKVRDSKPKLTEEKKTHVRENSKPFAYNPPGTSDSHHSQQSISVSTNSNNLSFYSQDGGMSGERVKVAVRIRPLMKHEKGHNPIVEVENMK